MSAVWVQRGVYILALYVWWNFCASYFGDPVPLVSHEVVVERTPAPFTPTHTVAAQQLMQQVAAEATKQPAADQPVAQVPAARQPEETPRRSEVGKMAGEAKAEAAPATEVAPVAAGECSGRRPYHLLLTAQGTFYNQWQARIMYHHWKKQAAAGGPCTDMTGFTRLCASKDGLPDGVEKVVPSVFVKQLTTEVLAKYGHFGVLNRPHSVVEFLKSPELLGERAAGQA